MALVAVLFVWLLVAQLDIVASAPARLVPVSQLKVVQSARPGIVGEILVRDGERVVAGQVLLRLDATVAGADAMAVVNELMLKRVTLRALDAELGGQLPTSAVICWRRGRHAALHCRRCRRRVAAGLAGLRPGNTLPSGLPGEDAAVPVTISVTATDDAGVSVGDRCAWG